MKINASLVSRLIASQFPHWADLPVRPVDADGWDNRTFRLGEDKSVRLPSAERYSAQVEKEQRWLPLLAPLLPLPIPVPIAMGVPAFGYPWPWSVNRWLGGESATSERIGDLQDFATAIARFLVALQEIDASGGPPPGRHNFFRAGPLSTYDSESRDALAALRGTVDSDAATAVWNATIRSTWRGTPVWIHGDVSAGNLLVNRGRLCGVIDFGCSGVGDPACDLAIAWTLFSGRSRGAFRDALPVDDATWARGRGWALWKALITLSEKVSSKSPGGEEARRTIQAVLADHEATP